MSAVPSLVDSHCHLDPRDYDGDVASPIARARAAGVVGFVVIGSGAGLADCDVAIGHAEREPDAFAAIAVHPHDATRLDETTWRGLEERARHPRVVAIGETGLDYHYDHSPRETQTAALRRFIALARSAGKPLSLHIRDAHDDAQHIVREERGDEIGGVVHCFTGGAADARAWLDLGFHLSFSGIVTFKSADAIRAAARLCPADRLLIETDCPYLAPVPHRGERNEPAFIRHTAEQIALLRGDPLELFAETSRQATVQLFHLPP